MALLRSLFWFALFLASTFFFVVVFEHGFTNFGANAKTEIDSLKVMVGMQDKAEKKDKPAGPPPPGTIVPAKK